MGQFKLKLFLGVLLLVVTGVILGHFVPVWAAQPTVANAIPNQNATEDSAFNFQFAINTFEDTDGHTFTYSSQLAGGGALPGWLDFDPVTRTFSGTPFNGDVGTRSIDVIADDGNGDTVTDTFDIIVANTNDAPTVANVIPNQNATEDSAFNFTFASNTFNDVDISNTLTYSAQLAGGGALPAWLSFDANLRTFSGTPLNAHVGTVSIDVIADDGSSGTVTDTFNIVIANTNDAPAVANLIPNQNATEDAAFNFTFAANTFNDVDLGDSLTYTTQLAGGGTLPMWLSFNSATRTFSGIPTNGDVGTASIDVIADDGNGGTVTDTFNIEITAVPDEGPTDISLGNNSIQQSTTDTGVLVGTLSSSDVDSSDFTYTLVSTADSAPGSCASDEDNANFQIDGSLLETAETLAAGTYNICVQTSDGNSSYKKGFTIIVEDDIAPTASILVSDTSLVAGETATVTITFSEAVIGLTSADLEVGSGSLSGLSSSDGGVTWVATLTPSPGVADSTNIIVLNNAGMTDLNGNPGTGTTSSDNYAVDTLAPNISNILATSSDNGESATITWTTNKAASSQIAIGLTSGLVNGIYAEQNTSPRVTSHSYQLPDLKPCTSYYYQVLSKDALNQQTVSTIQGFTTNGCPGAVIAHAEELITAASGGSLSLGDITVTVPSGFAAGDATFQIKRIDASEAQETIGKPGTLLVLGGYMYHITAYADTSTTIDDFLQPITITFNYSNTNLTGIDSETLMIYHYDDTNDWNELNSCTTDIANKTIACETSSFSTFALVASVVVPGGLTVQPGVITDLVSTGQSMPLYAVIAGLLVGGGSALIVIRRNLIVKN